MSDAGDSEPDDQGAGDDEGGLPVGRRALLIGVPAAGVGLAGCYAALTQLDGGGGIAGGEPTPTPSFGYGGTRTDDGGAGGGGTPTATDGSNGGGGTPTSTTGGGVGGGTPTSTSGGGGGTPTSTGTAGSTQDDYGEQLYGQYGYGGVGP